MNGLETLFTVQSHDTVIDQLRHRLETLPERAELAKIDDALFELEKKVAEIGGARDAVARRQQAAEDEVASLEVKITELDKRLYSGSVSSPRELQSMQADLESLKRHRGSIEDRVIEAMEEREPLDAELEALAAERDRLDQAAIRLRAELAEAESALGEELAREQAARDEAAGGVSAEALAQYEQLRHKLGGVAVARLENGNRCGGCQLTLPAAEVARIKREPLGSVIQCEDCDRILVRVEPA